jgi:hypothetical protein
VVHLSILETLTLSAHLFREDQVVLGRLFLFLGLYLNQNRDLHLNRDLEVDLWAHR